MISKARIKQLRALHLKKNRTENRAFLAEGTKIVLELLMQDNERIKEIYALPDFIDENGSLLKSIDVKYTEVNERELEQISSLQSPNKVVAECVFFEAVELPSKGSILYMDDIRDPGNFGTIIRLADWFGMKQIHCSSESCELYNPKVIQSTMGSFMRVRVNYCELKELASKFPDKKIYGAVLGGMSIYEQKLEDGIIVIGNEANGIRHKNLAVITDPITIPTGGESKGESLNAAMAASIIVAEFFRSGHFNK